MKLELVDQRPRAGDTPWPSTQLAELVAALGQEDWVLNLVLVEDPTMADLYSRWYGGQGVTDVLSFTYLENQGLGEPHLKESVGQAARDLWVAPGDGAEEVTAGEVVLAPDFVARRCAQEGWDLKTEWALLLVHGALHVLGWEHQDPAQRLAMRTHEAAVLETLGLAHPLLHEEPEKPNEGMTD